MFTDDMQKMGHLMRRAGFGASYEELQRRSKQGIDATIEDLLNGASAPAPTAPDDLLSALIARSRQQRLQPAMLKPWWVYRMATTPNPLQEKMVLFWHGHFATSASKVNPPTLMLQQNRFFRDNALGNWRTILQGVSRDPAMIKWLDNDQNARAHPNENYGRELMELFSLGIGNYTETDVKQAARAFTGWSTAGGNFTFLPARHDDAVKTFLGRTGNFDGDDIVNIILEQPAAADFMVRKLFTFFAYPDPEPAVVKDLSRKFRASDFNVRTLVEAIFKSDAFWSPRAVGTQIKSPAQLVVGSLRALNVPELSAEPSEAVARPLVTVRICQQASNALKQMGQDLFYPPNVKGWDGGTTWINAATVFARINFATTLTTMIARNGMTAFAGLTGDPRNAAPDAMVDEMLSNLGPIELPAAAKAAVAQPLQGHVLTASVGRGQPRAAAVRSAVALALQSPQYQLC